MYHCNDSEFMSNETLIGWVGGGGGLFCIQIENVFFVDQTEIANVVVDSIVQKQSLALVPTSKLLGVF